MPSLFSKITDRLTALITKSARPFCDDRTFYLWEPCSKSHSEVLPGYARYLLDLGYSVSVLLTPRHIADGLFSRFSHPRLHLNTLSQGTIRRYFQKNGLGPAAGILITTSGKLAAPGDYARQILFFGERSARQKILLVEHDVQAAYDAGTLYPEIITLRTPHYQQAQTTPVNPHYFGDIAAHTKNLACQFVTIGALRSKRRNTSMLVEAVRQLHQQGCTNFRIAVVGKGNIRHIPQELRAYFTIHGRLDFSRMYSVIEQSDFLLPLLDSDNAAHQRYITTGTSGTFQLAFGFAKPCVIEKTFSAVNGFTDFNSIIYSGNHALADAMQAAIQMPTAGYASLRDTLATDATTLADDSAKNLKALLHE